MFDWKRGKNLIPRIVLSVTAGQVRGIAGRAIGKNFSTAYPRAQYTYEDQLHDVGLIWSSMCFDREWYPPPLYPWGDS